jgi:methyl coenzyme M reductase beta subunit
LLSVAEMRRSLSLARLLRVVPPPQKSPARVALGRGADRRAWVGGKSARQCSKRDQRHIVPIAGLQRLSESLPNIVAERLDASVTISSFRNSGIRLYVSVDVEGIGIANDAARENQGAGARVAEVIVGVCDVRMVDPLLAARQRAPFKV